MATRPKLQRCFCCGAFPGQLHRRTCDLEHSALCGEQKITCDCVLVVNGLSPDRLKQENPSVYWHGPTSAMRARYRREVKRFGGRLPWTGDWLGAEQCAALGWFGRPHGSGFVRCSASAPGAMPDIEKLLHHAHWDRTLRRYVFNLVVVRGGA